MLLFVPMRVSHTGRPLQYVKGAQALAITSIHACIYNPTSDYSAVMEAPMSVKEASQWLAKTIEAEFTDDMEQLCLVFVARLDVEMEAFTRADFQAFLEPLIVKKLTWWACPRTTLMSHRETRFLKKPGWIADTLTGGDPTLHGLINAIREFGALSFLDAVPFSCQFDDERSRRV